MSVVIVGVGNRDRGDDALGLEAVDRLRARVPEGVHLESISGDMTDVLETFDGRELAIVIDAMHSGAEPGTVLRLDVTAGEMPVELERFLSSHTLSLAEAIELARTLGRIPLRLIVFGVEIAAVSLGRSLSPEVRGALSELTEHVLSELQHTVDSRRPGAPPTSTGS